ncbi:MAG: hypothetical protein WCH10_06000 [bacterium]
MTRHIIAFDTLIDSNLATKQDIRELKLITEQSIRELDLATKQSIGELELKIELIKKDIKYIMVVGSIFGSMIPVGFTTLGFLMMS